MLTFAEEIFLLALDDRQGALRPMPVLALDYALAGAVITELALQNRVDTDVTTLTVVNPAPTGDPLLDDALAELTAAGTRQKLHYWLEHLSGEARQIQAMVLKQLVDRGILKCEDRRILWVFHSRRYPLLDNREIKEVRLRLRELILSQDIPDPRDAVLISLADACCLLGPLFTREERDLCQPRIAALAKLDLVGQEVAKAVRNISQAIALATAGAP